MAEAGSFIRVRRILCRLGIHQRREFICGWCLSLACPPGVAVWINRCLNPECAESGPRFCDNHQESPRD